MAEGPRTGETAQPATRLRRSLGLPGAVAIGVAAMVGTGVFAVWSPVHDLVRGPLLLVSLLIAAAVASLNAWSTARLAAAIPRSGGVYAYGRALVSRPVGVLAGYAFWVSKSGSSAVAALTIGAYLWPGQQRVVALVAIALALVVDLAGIVRSARVLAVTASLVLIILMGTSVLISFAGPISGDAGATGTVRSSVGMDAVGITAAAAFLFIAFAGYARIATLGEEVRDPSRTIPRAMMVSLCVVVVAYLIVASAIVVASPDRLAAAALLDLARQSGLDGLAIPLRVAVVLAAGGTLLSLIAGMGRTVFAMAAEGDAPRMLSAVDRRHAVPRRAEVVVALGVALVALLGGIPSALAVAAVAIMLYYAIAHAAALRLPRDAGRPPVLVPLLGLAGCLGLGTSLLWVTVGT